MVSEYANENHHHHHAASHGALVRIIVSAILYLAANLISEMIPSPWIKLAIYIGIYLFVGFEVLLNALKGILHGHFFDENFLMTIATLGVFALALFEGSGDYGEAIAVILFFQIGEYFQGFASRKSQEKINALGRGNNQLGYKSRSEAFITRFAKVYTPFVCAGALILAILPPLVNICIGDADANWNTWIYRALTFLVISCPCALVISIPMTFFASIICASKNGILVADGCNFEALHKGSFPKDDIIIIDNDDSKKNIAKKIADRCMGIIWQNIIFAIGVKLIVLVLSAFGITNMWLAVFADTGIMILAVLNAMRALYIKQA